METQIEPIKILDELTKNFDLKFFKTMSEPVRLEILKFLMINGRSDIGTGLRQRGVCSFVRDRTPHREDRWHCIWVRSERTGRRRPQGAGNGCGEGGVVTTQESRGADQPPHGNPTVARYVLQFQQSAAMHRQRHSLRFWLSPRP